MMNKMGNNNIWGREISTYVNAVILIVLAFFATSLKGDEVPAKRFEYKLSFKGPYLVLRNGTVPFWEHQGSAIASDESVRITPSLKSKQGAIWSKEINQFENWEVEVTFRISGRGRVGADGLAVWYTTEKSIDGPVFGSKDIWSGLGVFFDSFDNDNKHNNPFIMAMVNDGTKAYEHEADGSNQQLGGCLRDFRNRPHPTRVKIEYYKKSLTIYFNNGLAENPGNYDLCLKVDNVDLPPSGYFGVSAATGGLADDHDVLSFITNSLHAPTHAEGENQVMEDERKKLEKEYQEYLDKLLKAKEDYKKENPQKRPHIDDEENLVYEGQEARELRQIFEGQHEIFGMVRTTMERLEDIGIRQERQLHSLTKISQQLTEQPPSGNNMDKSDLEQIMRAQTLFSGDVKELKSFVTELANNLNLMKSQEVANNERLAQAVHSRVQEEMRIVHKHLSTMETQLPAKNKYPSCISLPHLALLLTLHLIVILAYLIFKARKEAAAKKLF